MGRQRSGSRLMKKEVSGKQLTVTRGIRDWKLRKVEMYRYEDLIDRVRGCRPTALKLLMFVLLTRCEKNGVFEVWGFELESLSKEFGIGQEAIVRAAKELCSAGLVTKLYTGIYRVSDGDFAIRRMDWERHPLV